MSPLWRDEIRIRFAPGEVSVARMNRGLRPVCAGELAHCVESSGLQWQPALAALETLLGDSRWRAPHARIVVSNLWARYAIVPWAPELVTSDERLSHAGICLAATYGSMDDSWRVSLGEAEPGKSRVACALPEGLIAGLTELMSAHDLKVVSLQPLLIAAYNEWRHQLPEEGGWLVCIEDGALAAARLGARDWDRVYSARIGPNWSVELLRLRTFARMASSSGEAAQAGRRGPRVAR